MVIDPLEDTNSLGRFALHSVDGNLVPKYLPDLNLVVLIAACPIASGDYLFWDYRSSEVAGDRFGWEEDTMVGSISLYYLTCIAHCRFHLD